MTEPLSALLGESPSRVWFKRPAVWAALVVVLFLPVSWWAWHANALAHAAPRYVTETAARGNLTLVVSANGTIQPTRSINIGSELSGTVLEVRVDVNDHVKKGQVMVVLDTAKLRDQILRSKAALEASMARVDSSAVTAREAHATLTRLETVAKMSGGRTTVTQNCK